MQTTLFCHYLNEEILLPGWLNHHKKLFNHGVMLDWGSEDNSTDIIREICPSWEIINFQPHEERNGACSWKIQELESLKNGWKCALNVSEYLIVDDLEKYIEKFEKNNPDQIGVRTTSVILVDEPGDHSVDSFRDVNILHKKKFGYLEYGNAWDQIIHPDGVFRTVPENSFHYEGFKNRLLHKVDHGHYTVGRHNTTLPVGRDSSLYLAWIGRGSPELYHYKVHKWQPLYDKGIRQFHAISWSSYDLGFYMRLWESELSKSVNIFDTLPRYKKHIDKLYGA